MLTSSQRKLLRGLAHPLKPLVHVGKEGLSSGVLANVESGLEAHELIKVRFLEFKERKQELVAEIAARLQCDVAGTVGHVAILYRPARDERDRRIRLTEAE